jgi:hypothetical protein
MSIGFERAELQASGGNAPSTRSGPWVSAWLPLLWHPASHFFVGFGPNASYVFAGSDGGPGMGGARFSAGAGVVVGGWIGGAHVPSAAIEDADDTPPATSRVRRFGDVGEIVLSSDLGVSGGGTSYTDAGGNSSWSVAIAPAFDGFVAHNISFGVGFDIFSGSENGTDVSTGTHYTSTRSGGSLAPRLGWNISIADWLSVWARLTIGYGLAHRDLQELTASDHYSERYAWVGIYVPVLFHLAQHFFVGFGPSASTDLAHWFTPDNSIQWIPTQSTNNRGSTVGAALTVGGWL